MLPASAHLSLFTFLWAKLLELHEDDWLIVLVLVSVLVLVPVVTTKALAQLCWWRLGGVSSGNSPAGQTGRPESSISINSTLVRHIATHTHNIHISLARNAVAAVSRSTCSEQRTLDRFQTFRTLTFSYTRVSYPYPDPNSNSPNPNPSNTNTQS